MLLHLLMTKTQRSLGCLATPMGVQFTVTQVWDFGHHNIDGRMISTTVTVALNQGQR